VIRVYDAAGNVIETHKHKAISNTGFSRNSGIVRLREFPMDVVLALLVLLDDFAHGAHLPNLGETFFR